MSHCLYQMMFDYLIRKQGTDTDQTDSFQLPSPKSLVKRRDHGKTKIKSVQIERLWTDINQCIASFAKGDTLKRKQREDRPRFDLFLVSDVSHEKIINPIIATINNGSEWRARVMKRDGDEYLRIRAADDSDSEDEDDDDEEEESDEEQPPATKKAKVETESEEEEASAADDDDDEDQQQIPDLPQSSQI